jgi:hypothetical protein
MAVAKRLPISTNLPAFGLVSLYLTAPKKIPQLVGIEGFVV